jgi:WD40 repeat protein
MITDISKPDATSTSIALGALNSITCAVSTSMSMIAHGGYDGICNIHTLNGDNSWSLQPVIKIPITNNWLTRIKFLDEDTKILVSSRDGTASVYEIETKTKLLSLHHDSEISGSVVLFIVLY